MTKKHCTKHTERGRSSYVGGSSVKMKSLEDLRRIQNARERQCGSPWPEPYKDDEARLRLIRGFRSVPESLRLR